MCLSGTRAFTIKMKRCQAKLNSNSAQVDRGSCLCTSYRLRASSLEAEPCLCQSGRVSTTAGSQGSREGDLGPPDTGHSRWQPLASAEDHRGCQFGHLIVSDTLWPPCTTAHQASLSITNSRILLKLMSIKSVMPFNNLILCCPLPLLLLPSVFPSIRVFSSESLLHIRRPKYWSFGFSTSNEYSGLISFRIDWFDFLAVQGTLKSHLQHHSSKASVLQCSAFFIVQLLHLYMTTGKTIALTRWTFVGKVMSLLFNTLSRFVIAFLPRSKCLLILWLQSPPAVILEPKKIKFVPVSTVSPSICHEVMGPDVMILVFWMLSFKQLFHSPLSLSSRGSLVLLCFLP